MRYAMLINGVEAEWDDPARGSTDDAMASIYAWFDKWSAAGKIADGGAELASVTKARTIRPDGAGGLVVTDGPYAELKEVIGGVVMLEAESMDDAVAVASTWPTLWGSSSLEIRPVIEH